MITKIRSWAYFFSVLSFAILGIAETTVVKSNIKLFDYIPIPSLTKFILPIITCSVFIAWCMWMLIRLGIVAEYEDADDMESAKAASTRIIMESPTACIALTLSSIMLLNSMQQNIVSWDVARAVYSYGILWATLIPCFVSILEFLQGITGFEGFAQN